jgi:hypothetical protein
MRRRPPRPAAALAAAIGLLAVPPAAIADAGRVDQLGPFARASGGGDQRSSVPYAIDLRTDGELRVMYRAPRSHCSALRVHLSVDASAAVASDPVAPAAESGVIDLGPLAPGVHTLMVNAEGIRGGCNQGVLSSWGGTLVAWTSGPDAGALVPGAAELGEIVFESELTNWARGFRLHRRFVASSGAVRDYDGNGGVAPVLAAPIAEDGYYGADWLSARYGVHPPLTGEVAPDAVARYAALARSLVDPHPPGGRRRPGGYDAGTTTYCVYVRDPSRGAYRRIVLAQRGDFLWDEGSPAASAITAWLVALPRASVAH